MPIFVNQDTVCVYLVHSLELVEHDLVWKSQLDHTLTCTQFKLETAQKSDNKIFTRGHILLCTASYVNCIQKIDVATLDYLKASILTSWLLPSCFFCEIKGYVSFAANQNYQLENTLKQQITTKTKKNVTMKNLELQKNPKKQYEHILTSQFASIKNLS